MKKLLERWGFGMGGVAENSMQNTLPTLANPIFNVAFGVSPVLVGIAMSLPRFWEILLDPWIGTVSDNTASSWGRRRPFIIIGGVISAVLFAAIWWVPVGWSPEAKGWWLIVSAFLFYTAYSFFAVPYAAFALEVTQDDGERIQLMAARTALANASAIGINWLYWLTQLDWFSGTAQGIRWVGTAFAVVIGLAAIIPALITREQRMETDRITLPVAAPVPKISVFASGWELIKLRPLQWMLASMLLFIVGFTLVSHLGFYILLYYAYHGDSQQVGLLSGVSGTITSIVAVLICPLVAFAANRIGKTKALMFFLAVGGIGSLSFWWSMNPHQPYWVITSSVAVAFGLSAYWTTMPAFLGDISDAYERKTGIVCQGLFTAIYGIAAKIGVSVSFLLTGYTLIFCRFDVKQTLEEMADPLTLMRVLFCIVPALGMALAAFSIWKCRPGEIAPMTRLDPQPSA